MLRTQRVQVGKLKCTIIRFYRLYTVKYYLKID